MSDEYSSRISRDRSLACVLASRMLASYVPLASGGPTRATVVAGIAHVMQAVCSTENELVRTSWQAHSKQAIDLACDKIKACTRGCGTLCAREADVAECFSTPAAYGDLYIIDVFRHYELHFACSVFTYRC